MRNVRDFLFEGENVFDVPVDWWEKWKKLHDGEYDISKDDFQNTVVVRQGGEVVLTYDKTRNKVFTDRPLEFVMEGSVPYYRYLGSAGALDFGLSTDRKSVVFSKDGQQVASVDADGARRLMEGLQRAVSKMSS